MTVCHMRLIGFAGIVVGCVLATAFVARCALKKPLPATAQSANDLYVWQRHWSEHVEAAVGSELEAGTHDLYLQEGELEYNGAKAQWHWAKVPEDRVTGRFNYRRKAMEYARASVLLAKDPDIRAWALMFGGVVARSLDDVQWADWFYKRLASMRHPRAKVGGWFNGPVYEWFRDTYYNQERQAVPMRVPQRFTKEQLSRLAAPPPK